MSARAPLRVLDDALAELLAHARTLEGTESVSTFDADGRVLAQDLVSALQVPPQDNSAMDGYAVRSHEIADEGVVLPVSQRVPAGAAPGPKASPRGVEFYAQAWNILNETNFTRYSGVMTSPYFLQPTAAAAARRFDFGTRVFF